MKGISTSQERKRLFVEAPLWESMELLWKAVCEIGAQGKFKSQEHFFGCCLLRFEEMNWTTRERDSADNLVYRSTPKFVAQTEKPPGALELRGYFKN